MRNVKLIISDGIVRDVTDSLKTPGVIAKKVTHSKILLGKVMHDLCIYGDAAYYFDQYLREELSNHTKYSNGVGVDIPSLAVTQFRSIEIPPNHVWDALIHNSSIIVVEFCIQCIIKAYSKLVEKHSDLLVKEGVKDVLEPISLKTDGANMGEKAEFDYMWLKRTLLTSDGDNVEVTYQPYPPLSNLGEYSTDGLIYPMVRNNPPDGVSISRLDEIVKEIAAQRSVLGLAKQSSISFTVDDEAALGKLDEIVIEGYRQLMMKCGISDNPVIELSTQELDLDEVIQLVHADLIRTGRRWR